MKKFLMMALILLASFNANATSRIMTVDPADVQKLQDFIDFFSMNSQCRIISMAFHQSGILFVAYDDGE